MSRSLRWADENEKGGAIAAERLKAKAVYADNRQMLVKERPQISSILDHLLECGHGLRPDWTSSSDAGLRSEVKWYGVD